MINSAMQYPVHNLISHESNTLYRVPPYQREYSWTRQQWEELFDDLVEADGAHFLGTIICLNATTDATAGSILELVDGQQRLTTILLLLAAIYSILNENREALDEDDLADLTNLRRQLVSRQTKELRLRPQRQGNNLDDYRQVMSQAGIDLEAQWISYFPVRRISKCYEHFRKEIQDYAADENIGITTAAQRVYEAVNRAIIVKIEVSTQSDAFVLFESLNNRGMPLSPVDLIKNHLLAESERKGVLDVETAFAKWDAMLTSLGDSYANHERFLRHYYNAFKHQLPHVTSASVATRSNLIRIYEVLVESGVREFLDEILNAAALYGRITGNNAHDAVLDEQLLALGRAQGAPSYVLVLFLMTEAENGKISENQLVSVVRLLVAFFVRRNLTRFPQTYVLPKLFMTIIEKLDAQPEGDAYQITAEALIAESVSDEDFLQQLATPVYEDNVDVSRFILTTLAEHGMTRETRQNLWAREKNRYVWTIEHILPQGKNLPTAWQDMLGGKDTAADAQALHVHKLGNLTITGYNSSLSNKSFVDKKNRTDNRGNYIGYRNNISLNKDVVTEDEWTVEHIERRTARLARDVLAAFPLTTPED